MAHELALTYAQIESLLADLHQIREHRITALRARLKHFKRLNFPPGVNTGRGRRAEYGPGQLASLSLAFQLLELGFAPERAKIFLARIRDIVAHAVRLAAHGLMLPDSEEELDIFLCLDPKALMSLEGDKLAAENISDDTAFWSDSKALAEGLVDQDFPFVRRSMINISSLLRYWALHLESAGVVERSELYGAMREWALDAEHDQRLNREKYQIEDIFGPDEDRSNGDG